MRRSRWRRVMRRWRGRIVRCRRLPGHVRRSLVVGLHRRIAYARSFVQSLNRSSKRVFNPTRRIAAPNVRATGAHPLPTPGKRAAQNCARSRRCAPGRGKCLRTNVDSVHRCNRAPIKIQCRLMIWSWRGAATERPRTLGNRPTIHRHQPAGQWMRTARRIDGPYRHRPTRRMSSHHNHRRPHPAATAARSPSPTEGIVIPGAAVIGQPAPWIAGNPGVAERRIVGPVAGPIGIPARSDPGRNPYIARTLHRIPVTVGIQIIPVFILRIGRVIAHRGLLRRFLGDRLIPILIPVIPGIAIDSLGHGVRSPAIVGAGTDALVLRHGYAGNTMSLHVDRAADHRNFPSGIQTHTQD